MSEEEKRILEKQLWAVANVLRGKMNAERQGVIDRIRKAIQNIVDVFEW